MLKNLATPQDSCVGIYDVGFLAEETIKCPCEEKGVKNLTDKNDLLKAISIMARPSSSDNRDAKRGVKSRSKRVEQDAG